MESKNAATAESDDDGNKRPELFFFFPWRRPLFFFFFPRHFHSSSLPLTFTLLLQKPTRELHPAPPAAQSTLPCRPAHQSIASQPPVQATQKKIKSKGKSKRSKLCSSTIGIKKKKKTRWRRRRPPLPHRAAPSSPRTPPGTPPSTWASAGPSTARWVGSSPPRCSSVSVVEMRLVAGEEGEKIHRESSRFSTSTS